ncbi:hypothetical protein P148_SR1C00001G1011 [candidate division SR1 bacterium RAAC1_SR1_1]|nr:hypothetical protein P148_SR1C00001G1011 [candidate division SR1 bacterium RAAC1_SR1_1]
MFGQTLTVSSDQYSKDGTNNVINVRPGTVVTITASLGGATSTSWTSNPIGITAVGNQATLTFSTEIDVFVYFMNGATVVATKWVKLFPNPGVASGLLTQQNVRDCPNTTRNFLAADYNENFDYQWQEWTGSWVNLTANPNYSAINHSLTLQVNSSTVTKRFRAMIKNPSCLGAIDYTAEVIVLEVYQQPTFTISDNKPLSFCGTEIITYTITVTGGTPDYTVSLIGSSRPYVLVSPNNQSSVNVTTSGGTAQFDVRLANPPAPGQTVTGFTTSYIVVDDNGCYGY